MTRANGLEGPWGGIDTETTGVSVEDDRVVTVSVYYSHAQGGSPIRGWLINPGVEIPEEASAIHGVTTEQAAEDGLHPPIVLREVERSLEWIWANDAPVVGHNVIFDLTILDREFRRHLGHGLTVHGPVIDTLCLDKAVDPYRKGSRRLADTCRHWGVPVTDADLHTADGDVQLAVKLAREIITYGHVKDRDGSNYPLIQFPLPYLHSWQAAQYQQQRASFNSWLRGQGRVPDDENTVWPLKPYGDAS